MTKPTNKKELSKKPIKQKKDTSSQDVSFFCFYDVFYFIN